PPYTYSWNTTPVQTTAMAANLAAGTYQVTVTDANGCVATATAPILPPSTPIIASITANSPVSCKGGNDGSATVSATGGSAPYTYYWSSTPAQTTATAGALLAGTYTVIVTDMNGCTDTAQTTITQPASGPVLSTVS